MARSTGRPMWSVRGLAAFPSTEASSTWTATVGRSPPPFRFPPDVQGLAPCKTSPVPLILARCKAAFAPPKAKQRNGAIRRRPELDNPWIGRVVLQATAGRPVSSLAEATADTGTRTTKSASSVPQRLFPSGAWGFARCKTCPVPLTLERRKTSNGCALVRRRGSGTARSTVCSMAMRTVCRSAAIGVGGLPPRRPGHEDHRQPSRQFRWPAPRDSDVHPVRKVLHGARLGRFRRLVHAANGPACSTSQLARRSPRTFGRKEVNSTG